MRMLTDADADTVRSDYFELTVFHKSHFVNLRPGFVVVIAAAIYVDPDD
jgi:hypothetical protein